MPDETLAIILAAALSSPSKSDLQQASIVVIREPAQRSEPYIWSEDKARQYSVPERHSFGPWVRKQGFALK